MRVAQAASNHEVKYLRVIVDEYIRSGDANKPSTQNHGNGNHGNGNGNGNGHHGNDGHNGNNGSEKGKRPSVPNAGFGRKNHIELGRHNLRLLSVLDSDMGSVLSLIAKEEDRQRLILQDLQKLIENNTEIFPECCVKKGSAGNVLLHHVSTQADEKDTFGAINSSEHFTTRGEEIDDSYTSPPAIQVIEHSSHLLNITGKNVPYKLRRYMSHFPCANRIPPLEWLERTIMSIYVDKIRSDDSRISQGMQKYDLCEHVYQYFTTMYGLPTVVDVQVIKS